MTNTDNLSLRVARRRRRVGIYFLAILALLVVIGVRRCFAMRGTGWCVRIRWARLT